MGSVNKVILVGNLGRDAEVRYAAAGQAVANFSLATTEVWTGRDGEKREQTEWHRVALWGKQAESIGQYLVKGKQVFVEGRLQSRRVPKCRECDSFLPEREVRVEGVRPADLPDIKCGRCGKTAKPYLDTQVEIRGDRVTLLGSAGGGGARPSGIDRGEAPQSGQMNEPADVPEDDIPF